MAFPFDKWSPWTPAAVLSPSDVMVLQATQGMDCIELHPVLTNQHEFKLIFDLASGQAGGYANSNPQKDLPFLHKEEPATLPRVQVLYVINRYSPWVVEVKNAGGVKLGDITAALWTHFSEAQITDHEFNSLAPRQQEQIRRNALAARPHLGYPMIHPGLRTPRTPGPVPVNALRRTDWLKGKVLFDGLTKDDKYVAERLGFKSCNTFVMSLTS